LPIRADAEVYRTLLRAGAGASFSLRKGDAGYLVPATGEVEVGMVQVGAREGLVIENEKMVAINALRDSELILFVTAK
jgi:quercetin 2,3-dioxygenase